jgi:imidazolonepropionase-like amidohydrolase
MSARNWRAAMMRKALPMAAMGAAMCGAMAGLTPAAAQNVAITNARLVVGDGSAPVDGATVLVRGGRVVSAGAGVAVPPGVTVVDAAGQWVTPGIVAGFSRVGLIEVDAVDGSNDASAPTSPFSAAMDIAPALNPLGAPVAVNRLAGVTRALVYPGTSSGLFNGRGALVDLGHDADMVTAAGLFQYVEFGEAGATRAGGSRAATFLQFRTLLSEARDYGRNPAAYDGRSRDAMLTRADAEALLRVIDGRDRLFIHAERAADILAIIRLLREFPAIKPTLIGATEGWTVAPQIAAANIPVIASALNDLPVSFEQLAATQSNIGRMRAAGVTVAIGLVDDNETHKLGYARQYAGNLVALTRLPGATGLNWDQAFASISSGPARAAGVDGMVGSLLPGRVGDVVIWDGDPLELSSAPVAVYIDGVAQPMTSRQTELRNRYLVPVPADLPNAYDR